MARSINSGAIHLLRGMREIDRQSGQSPGRLSALSVLVFGGPLPLGKLAKAEGVAGPTMTRIVDGLVAHGLASRSVDHDNGRITIVGATPEGERVMRDAAQRRIDAIVLGLQHLSPEQALQIADASAALLALPGAMREARRDPPGPTAH